MERDDIIEYSLYNHHDENAGKAIRKKIYFVTLLLTAITVIEVIIGAFVKQSFHYWELVQWGFIIMTLVKASYIVLIFMHLGDENKSLKKMILVPYFVFIIYLIFICIVEALAVHSTWLNY